MPNREQIIGNKKIFKIFLLNFIILLFPVFSFAQQSSVNLQNFQVQTDSLGFTSVVNSYGNSNNPTVQDASQSGFSIVQNCLTGKKISNGETECGWGDLIVLARRIMVYMIYIGTTLAALSAAYAGFMYATSAGNTGKIEKAHQVFTSVAIGILFLWGGWLLIATIMSTLGVEKAFSLVDTSSVKPVSSGSTKSN